MPAGEVIHKHVNEDPKPFMWTASATSIMAKLKAHHPNEPEHETVNVYSVLGSVSAATR